MRSRTSAFLILLFTFVLGGACGALSYHLYRSQVRAAEPRGGHSPSPHRITEQLARDLGLDAGQKEQLEAIIKRSRERYKALSLQFRPQYQAMRAETNEEIRNILREDQKARFEEILRGMEERYKSRGSRDSR